MTDQTQNTSSNEAAAVEADIAEATAAEQAAEDTELIQQFDLGNWLPEAWQPGWEALQEHRLLLIAAILLVGIVVGKVVQWLFAHGLARLTRQTKTDLDDRLIELLSRPVFSTVVLLTLMLIVNVLDLSVDLSNVLWRILSTLLVMIWLQAALRTIRLILEGLARVKEHFQLIEERTIPLFDIFLKLLTIAAAAYILLAIWGINPTAWLASAGVVGIAVGFAAKDTLANLFSGIFIVADTPYKIGDYIVLDSGERGYVTHVGMRSTRLMTRDDIEITIPNAVIANSKIINESGGPDEKERIRVKVSVAYGEDLDKVCELLHSLALKHDEIYSSPAPRVRVREFAESSINLELMGWIKHPELRGRVKHELFLSVYKAFTKAGISIPYPQRVVQLRNVPDTPQSP